VNEQIKPAPLMGATLVVGSDRYPMTIVYATDKLVGVVRDDYERIDANGLSEDRTSAYGVGSAMPYARSCVQCFWDLRLHS